MMLFSSSPELVSVIDGTFQMGNINGERDEKPVHSVTLDSYFIGKYPITVGQYKIFCSATGYRMPEAPMWDWNNLHPMVNVNYYDALNYCLWATQVYEGDWRLPTEAEWEYAARGGHKSNGYIYSGSDNPHEIGSYYDDPDEGMTNEVGLKKPNELGISDMSGNVSEWCKDWYGAYTDSPKENPQGAEPNIYKVSRGGSWEDTEEYWRVTTRDFNRPEGRFNSNGFRVVVSYTRQDLVL